MMPKKKPYFPNNWKAIKDAPHQFFLPLDFEEFMEWKMMGWEIPSSVECIIREENEKTGKITERVYTRQADAKKRIKNIIDKAESNFLLVSHESIHHLYPKEVGEPYEEDEFDYEID